MNSTSPRLKVGCVLPTNFDADVELRVERAGKKDRCFEHHTWPLAARDKFIASISHQMVLLRQRWLEETRSHIDVEPDVMTYDRPVTRIEMPTWRQPKYKITKPPRQELAHRLWGRRARAVFIYVPQPPQLRKTVKKKWKAPYPEGNYIWMPCFESTEVQRRKPKLRKGVNEELAHWVQLRLEEISRHICSPDDRTVTWAQFWGELREVLDAKAVRYLCTGQRPEDEPRHSQ